MLLLLLLLLQLLLLQLLLLQLQLLLPAATSSTFLPGSNAATCAAATANSCHTLAEGRASCAYVRRRYRQTKIKDGRRGGLERA